MRAPRTYRLIDLASDCGVDCIEDYPEYTFVRLTLSGVSVPPAEWRNCDLVDAAGACEIELSSDRTVELISH